MKASLGSHPRSCSIAFLAKILFLLVGNSRGADLPSDPMPVWMGNGSCAATACHSGRREPLDLKGSESTFSEAYDPHVRAFSVLYEDRSLRIEKTYRRLADIDAARPYEDDACLRCHVHQGYNSRVTRSHSPEFTVADGAGCESCHGPAGRWLVPHVQAGWQSYTDRQKLDFFGMRPTKDLLARGQTCAECHVGEGETDVNHDLIAAGHPRLNFDYSNHLAKLPKHWRVEDDQARHPDDEAKVWALGQFLTAKASLDLLESRAKRSIPEESSAPWPEFAEYSCFSCHHELVREGWASANVAGVEKPGSLQWGTWSLPLGNHLPTGFQGFDPDSPNPLFGSLRTEMAQPVPDARLVARLAREASGAVGRAAEALNQRRITPGEVRAMLESFRIVPASAKSSIDWDLAARQYLAIVALDRSASKLDRAYDPGLARQALAGLRENLNLPFRFDAGRTIFDSPRRLDFDRVRADLRAVQAALSAPGRTTP